MHPLTLAIALALAAAPAVAAEPAPAAASDSTTRAPGDTPPSAGLPEATGDDDTQADANPANALVAPPPWSLGEVQVVGQRLFPYQEGMVLNEAYIDEQVKGDGDLSSLLRINPNVQFDDTARTSRNMGEIRPADISINGAQYYQNSFVLDGASFTNDMDPASNNPNHFADPPSHVQGIAIDSSLIGSLTVYDSNVPASYGGFNGGVVDVESRKARDRLSGKVSLRMTRSAWNEVHIRDDYRESFENSTSAENQPEYDKAQLNVTVEGRTDNGLGLIGNITRTRSEIPLRGYQVSGDPGNDDAIKEQVRENTAASLRADWSSGRLSLGASVTYAPTDEVYFIQNARNSWFELEQGGPVASLRAEWVGRAWTQRHTLSYSDLDSSRSSDVDYWQSWRTNADRPWRNSSGLSTEGNWGSVDQTNRNVSWRMLMDRETFTTGGVEHRLQGGFEVSDRKATYDRIRDHTSYLTPVGTTTCTDANGVVDTFACSLTPTPFFANRGQYLSRRTIYQAGAFEVTSRDWAVFAHDDIRAGNWSFRPGVRVDGSDLVASTTIAPRFSMSWDIFGDRTSLATAGLNRYYGRNLFGYALREGRERLEVTQTRGASLVWGTPVRATTSTRFEALDVPYSDELALGFNQLWRNLDLNAKYVRREYRDEVMRVRVPSGDTTGTYDAQVYEYRNVGEATSDTWTLSVGLRSPWTFAGTSTNAQLAFDYTDTRRNYPGIYQDYSTTFTEDAYNQVVRYEGEIMRFSEMPSNGFNRPWTGRLATQTRIERLNLLWSNFLRYRAGFLGIYKSADTEVYQGETIPIYVKRDYPSSWSWDMALEYTQAFGKAGEAYVRVEAQNVLDDANLISGTTSTAFYEPGRSYWLELGYRF